MHTHAPVRADAASFGTIAALGIAQIISWGSVYYAFAFLIAPLMAASGADKPTVFAANVKEADLAGALRGTLLSMVPPRLQPGRQRAPGLVRGTGQLLARGGGGRAVAGAGAA